MKLLILGGGAGILYPSTRVLAAVTGPTDRMPEYPRFDLGPRTGTSHVFEGISLACLLLFVATLPTFARALDRATGESRSATMPVVLLSAWAGFRFAAFFVDPYLEFTVAAASAFLLCAGVLSAARLVARAHPLAGYGSVLAALFLFSTGITSLFPLEVTDARPLGLGLIHGDPTPFNPGVLVYVAAFVLWACWVAGVGIAMVAQRNQQA
ncbi:MAG: hypothetical protein ACMG6S_12835 [Byssovorax sp.]